MEFISQKVNIQMGDNQLNMPYAHGIKFIIEGDILRNRITFLYFKTTFIVMSILYQCKLLDIALAKLFLKIILPDFLRCSLPFGMVHRTNFQYRIDLDNHLLP